MENLKIFEEREVLGRQVCLYGTAEETLFLAKDVASWLGLTNVTVMINQIDESEVTKLNLGSQKGECNFLTEDGLYEVLMQSRKPIAKEFKKEVKRILKTIRKTGGYIVDKPEDTNEDILARAFIVAMDTIKRKDEKIKELDSKIEEQAPKVEFFDQVTDSTDAVDMAVCTKTLNMGIGRNYLFEILRSEKILQPNNQPYQSYIDRGWFRVIEQKFEKNDGSICIYFKTVVYQKGMDGIRKLLNKIIIAL